MCAVALGTEGPCLEGGEWKVRIERQPIVTPSVRVSSPLTYTFLPRNVTIRVVFTVGAPIG